MNKELRKELNQKHFLYLLAASFLITWAASRACRLTTFHLFTGLTFIACLFLGKQYLLWEKTACMSKKARITSVIISIIFTTLYLLGDYEGLLSGLNSRLFQIGHMLIVASGMLILFFAGVSAFLIWITDYPALAKETTIDNTNSGSGSFGKIKYAFNNHPFWFSFVFCLICWLPYLANNYPGVMTVDSLNQYGQIIGALPMSNHHPWVHTQLIRLFYETGLMLTGDEIFGLGLYTIFQMLVMVGIFAYLMDTMVLMHAKGGFCIGALLFYAILPYNGLYMVTMWKDILFSGMTLLFSTVIFRFFMHGFSESFPTSWKTCILYVVSGLGMCLLRSNGFYAFLLTLPFLLICFRKEWKAQLLMNFVILAVVLVIKGPVLNALEIASSDFVESLSIPIQLTARVYADGEAVDAADDEMWNKIMDTSKIPETYESFCSDHMKNLIRYGNQDYLVAHKSDYMKLWLSFGRKHPGAYLRGYIDATKGYWYPDVPNRIGYDDRIAENPYGLAAKPWIHNPLTIKIKEIVFKLPDMVPLYGLLFSLGTAFWVTILLVGAVILKSGFKPLIVFLPNAAIMATLFLATPVNNEFRYAYSLILTLPLFWLCSFYKKQLEVRS